MNPRIEIDREEFPFSLPVFNRFEELDLHPKVTFFVGENGSGKSTLLEAIAIAYGFPAEGGSKHHTYSTFDSHSNLDEKIILAKPSFPKESLFFRSESFYNLVSYLDAAARGEGGGPPRLGWTHRRSHGEGFLDTIAAYRADGLFLMDEPESALSVQGQLTFLAHMKRLVDCGSQFIIATHSPILLGFGQARIYRFSEEGIHKIAYRDTEQYQLTLEFLKNRSLYANILGLEELTE